MPVLPLMPSGADQMQTPMQGQPPPAPAIPSGPPGGMGGGDLSSLLGGSPMGASPSPNGFDLTQGAMRMFDQLAQMVSDVAGMFPGSDQNAMEMMEALDRWRSTVLTTLTPTPAQMPGAQQMM